MKSSVASRKQRFWALLLAVVMVVGLLPTAGVKADNKTIKKEYWLDGANEAENTKNGIVTGTIFKAGDTITGDFVGGQDRLSVTYLDVDGISIAYDAVSLSYQGDDNEVHAKIVTEITGGDSIEYEDDYSIRGYEDACSGNLGSLCANENVENDTDWFSDYWVVIYDPQYNPRDLRLQAIPKYSIKWDYNGGQKETGANYPETYIPYDIEAQKIVSTTIDLTNFKPTKANYLFAGWEVEVGSTGDVRDYLGDDAPDFTGEDGAFVDMGLFDNKINSDNCEVLNYLTYESLDENDGYFYRYSIRLRAKWMPYYTINYKKGIGDMANGVTGEVDSQIIKTPWLLDAEYYDDGFVDHPQCTYEKDGYYFNGWVYADGSTAGEFEKMQYLDPEKKQYLTSGASIDLYADWDEVKTYTIHFNEMSYQTFDNELLDPGKVKGSILDVVIKDYDPNTMGETTLDLPKTGYSLTGYYIEGWDVLTNVKKDVTGKITYDDNPDYFTEASVKYSTLVEHADNDGVINLYAWWVADKNAAYKFTFDNNIPTAEVTQAPIPDTDPILGYFWGEVYESGGIPSVPADGSDDQDAEMDDDDDDDDDEYDMFGKIIMPKMPQSEKYDPRHYNFLGWRVKKASNEATNNDGNLYSPDISYHVKDLFDEAGLTWISTKDIDKNKYHQNDDFIVMEGEKVLEGDYYLDVIPMEAVWEAKTYDIIFDANTASKNITLNLTSLEEYNYKGVKFDDNTIVISYPDLEDTADNYGLVGWTLDQNGTTKDFPISDEDKVRDIVLKADVLNEDGSSKYISDVVRDEQGDDATAGNADVQYSDGQITLYALWKEKHTVTFDYCYPDEFKLGVEIKKDKVFDGAKIDKPSPAPTYPGYSFAGWYYDPNDEGLDLRKEAQVVRPNTYYAANPMPNDPAGGDEGEVILEEFDFDCLLYSDITLIAKWTPIDYTVEFDANGGEAEEDEEMTPQGFVYDTAQELKANKYTKTGYTFGGWATTATGAKTYDDKQSVSNLSTADDSTVTLYALWNPNTYTVTFDKNNANASGTMTAQTFTYDAAQKLTANAFTNPGYTFAGWATSVDGEVVVEYADKEPVENLTTVNNGSVTLYAVWTQSAVVTLKFYPNGGVINDDDSELGYYEVSGPEGIIIDAPGEEVVTKNGYIFAGWEDENEDVTYKLGDSIKLYEGELYATWAPKNYVVVYDYNAPFESELNTKLEDTFVMDYYDNEEALVPLYMDPDVDTAAYKFLGWSAKPKSTVAEFDKEPVTLKKVIDAAFAAGTLSDDDVATLYGVWEKKKYNVTLVIGEEHGKLDETVAKQSVYYGEKVTAPDPAPTDFGYELKGWYVIGEEETNEWIFEEFTVTNDVTITAIWEPIDYTFKFEVGNQENGPKVDSREDVVKSYIEAIYLPKLSDEDKRFTFVGWAISDQATKAKYNADEMQDVCDIVDELEPEDNIITLYAVWTQKPTHTVIWQDENGNTIDTMNNVPEGEEDPDDFDGELPSKDDEQYYYEFDKWELVDDEDTDDVIYRATYKTTTLKKYNITFVDDDGITVLKEVDGYEYGTAAAEIVKPADPTKEGYEFIGWDPEITDVKGEATYKAVYTVKKYGVKFIDFDNRLISEMQYDYGTKAANVAKPDDPTRAGYTFTGWDKEIADVTGNATYTATYAPVNNGGNDNPEPPAPTYYTITWNNYNGTQLGTTQVEAGKVPAYNGATPTRAGDADYTYTFKGWTPVIAAATGNATYTAEFTATKRETYNNPSPSPSPTPTATPTPTPTPTPAAPQVYNIEYYEELEDGTVVQLKKTMNPDTYTYGVGAVIKYGIDKEGYKFNGWYSKRSKKYVDKVSETTKGTVKLYARFLPIDDGNGNGGDESAGTPDSEFGILCVRLTDYTEDSMTLMWDLMEGVDGYDIFGSRCNSKDVIRPYEPIDSVDANTDHYVANDLLKQTYYKFYVRAYILVNNEKRYITTSINVHGVTLNEKYGVADDIIVNKVVVKGKKSKTKYDSERDGYVEEINITMKVGQTLKIVASEYNADGKEIRAHRPISFESSKPDILKVGKKKNHKYGVEVKDKANTYKSHTIFANAAGECTIYVFAQNGLYTKVNVTIKAAK